MGIVDWRRGEIELDGKSIMQTPAHKLARAGVVLIPQGDALFPGLSVRDNLDSGAFAAGWRERKRRRERVLRLFPRLARAARPGRRHALRRRAAHVLARARPHVRRPRLPDRRAFARARARHRRRASTRTLRELDLAGRHARPRGAEPVAARGVDRPDRTDPRRADRRHRVRATDRPPRGSAGSDGQEVEGHDRSHHHHQSRRHLRAGRRRDLAHLGRPRLPESRPRGHVRGRGLRRLVGAGEHLGSPVGHLPRRHHRRGGRRGDHLPRASSCRSTAGSTGPSARWSHRSALAIIGVNTYLLVFGPQRKSIDFLFGTTKFTIGGTTITADQERCDHQRQPS